MTLILISVAAVCLGLALWLFARSRSVKLDLPGDLVYADEADDELLVCDRFRLTGRPDYILRSDGELIPVERKSRKVTQRGPFEGEILQLAAYCLLVEEKYQKPVQRGKLQYINGSVEVLFDAQLRGDLMRALEALDRASDQREVPRSHQSAARCRACGFRSRCDQSLEPRQPASS